ncbi:TPA: hypothetical protein QB623_001282 [Pasteurella multocida]|nr:hypothetical protein [Pasteurella multocida]
MKNLNTNVTLNTKAVNIINTWAAKSVPETYRIKAGMSVINDKVVHRTCAEALLNVSRVKKQKGRVNPEMQSDADCPYQMVKSAVYDLFNAELQAGFKEILFKGVSDDEIIEHFVNQTLPWTFDDALEYARDMDLKVDITYKEISAYIGRTGAYMLGNPRIMFPIDTGITGEFVRVTPDYLDPSQLDVRGFLAQYVWGIMKDKINAVTSGPRPTAYRGWNRLNADIVLGKFKFSNDPIHQVITFDDGTQREITTRGFGTQRIEWYEEQIFRNENPVVYTKDDRVVDSQPYAYDVRDTQGLLDELYEEQAMYHKAVEFREKYEHVMELLVDGINKSNVERATEARKVAKYSTTQVWIASPEHLATHHTTYTELVGGELVEKPLHLAEFDLGQTEVIEKFLIERRIHGEKERHFSREKENAARRSVMRKQFGWE